MGKALYVHDPYIRELVEEVKNELGLKSLRDTIEKGMLSLKREQQGQDSFEDIATDIQAKTRKFLGKEYWQMNEVEDKAFFDDLSGGI